MVIPRVGVGYLIGLCAATSVLSASALSAPVPTWIPCGWGGGGFYWSAAFDPIDDGVVYMGGDVAGVYKSGDHGRTWRMANNGLAGYGVFSLAVDPLAPKTVYAATELGLCRSADAGDHWSLLPHTGPNDLRITGEKGKSIQSIAIDAVHKNTVYAGSPGGGVFKSIDAGQTWLRTYGTERGGPVYSVTVSEKQPDVVLASTENGLILSSDSGRNWHKLSTPKRASSAFVCPSNPKILFASFFTDGVWKSTDFGNTWTDVSASFPKQTSILQVAADPSNAQNVFAIGSVGWGGHFFRSGDGGNTWTDSSHVQRDPTADPTLPNEAAVADLSSPSNLAVNPRNPKELFVSANWRPAHSLDGGKTWTEFDRGADISVITDIRFHNGKTYVAAMDEGVLASTDDGATWKQLWPLAWDPKISGHAWRIGFSGERLIATCSPWDTYPARIVVSDDGGKTVSLVTAGLPDYKPKANVMWDVGYPRALCIDPNDPKTAYLGIDGEPADGKSGGGIFKSIDAGSTWMQLPVQPATRRMFYGLAVDPTDSKRIYWGTCGENGGLYRSEDGGATWKRVFNGEDWLFNMAVTADGTVYCPGKNLWRSSDHGNTWQQLTHLDGSCTLIGMETDPRNPKTLWISATTWGPDTNGGIYKSTDGGATWQDITGDIGIRKPLILRFNPETNELWAGGPGLFRLKQ